MKFAFTTILLSSICVLAACDSKSHSKKESIRIGYEFKKSTCTTGRHDFASMTALCLSLDDDVLNKQCARDEREAYFRANCKGAFDTQRNGAAQIVPQAPAEAPSPARENRDRLDGDVFVRTLQEGQGSLVLHLNPTAEKAATLVTCVSSLDMAKGLLGDVQMGGVMLVRGSTITFKNDQSRSFNDGSKTQGAYIRIECN